MALRTYVAMLRVVFGARSDEHARRTAEWFEQHVQDTLDPNDDVSITQVICYGDSVAPDEQINRLKVARNELIKLNHRDTIYHAEEIDKMICKLQARIFSEDELAPNYDYNRIIEIQELLNKGEEPLI